MGYKKGQKYRKEPIQTELFDTELTEEEKKNAVIIYEPDAKHLKEVTDEQRETIEKMIEKLEEFDDVQNVYTNMK